MTIYIPAPTKDEFLAYERVRASGRFNMITDCMEAAKAAGLDITLYIAILSKYEELAKKYL